MKPALFTRFLYLSLCTLLLSWCSIAWTAPVVSNLSASQQPGTKQVKITYDVAAPGVSEVEITLKVSADGGATWNVPVTTVTGAIGAGVSVGTGKSITWATVSKLP